MTIAIYVTAKVKVFSCFTVLLTDTQRAKGRRQRAGCKGKRHKEKGERRKAIGKGKKGKS